MNGTGIQEPKRKISRINSVYRIFLRSSGMCQAFLRVWNTLNHLGLSACGFDLLLCRSGECSGLDRQFLGQGAVAEDLHTVESILDDTGLTQGLCGDLGAIFKLLQSGNINRCIGGAENVVETTLRQAACQRHLAAFKTRGATAARPGPLALVTAAPGLAVAGTRAAALRLGGPSGREGEGR